MSCITKTVHVHVLQAGLRVRLQTDTGAATSVNCGAWLGADGRLTGRLAGRFLYTVAACCLLSVFVPNLFLVFNSVGF